MPGITTTTTRTSSAELIKLLVQARSLSDRFGRADLTDRVAAARARLADRPLEVAVIRASSGPADQAPAQSMLEALRTAAAGGAPGVSFRDATGTAWAAHADGPAAVLFLADAAHEYGREDFAVLQQIRAAGIPVVAVSAGFDQRPDWQQVQRRNRGLLQLADLDDPPMALLPVSAALCVAGLDRRDEPLLVASGVPQLFDFLTDRLDTAVDLTPAQLVTDALCEVAAGLTETLERQARQAAAVSPPAVRLEIAAAELERRQHLSTKWQLTLGDGFADLVAAVDFDLRDRLRDALEEADVVISGNRPLREWENFQETVRASIAQGVEESYRFAANQTGALARRVAITMTGEPSDAQPRIALPATGFPAPGEVLDRVRPMEPPYCGAVSARLINSLRGCYGGILMVGVLTSLAGMKLISTWSVAAGVLLGLFTFWEDRRSGVERGRAEAKVAVSRFLDAVNFRVGEDLRTQLRGAHRAMRDHYTSLNDQRLRAAANAVRSAELAIAEAEFVPAAPTAQEIAAVAELRVRVDALSGPTQL
jgi:hypothetical protein